MIIVEGPDGSGKSTLVKQLQERYSLEVNPRVVAQNTEAMIDLKSWVTQNLKQGFQYKLFDRHRLISEFIYGPILRQKQHDGFTDPYWVHSSLEKFYKLSPLIIYCLPPLDVIRGNLENDDSNAQVQDHTEAIYASYLERINLDRHILPGHVTVWDYTTDFMLEDDPLRYFDGSMNYARERAKR